MIVVINKIVLILLLGFCNAVCYGQSRLLNDSSLIVLVHPRDTQFCMATDSFVHDLGLVAPRNGYLIKKIKIVGNEPVVISSPWTSDPHFICDYPREPMLPSRIYFFKVCFYFEGRGGYLFNKMMGFELSNGQRISFQFRGRIGEGG
jgi:hypothetical protein